MSSLEPSDPEASVRPSLTHRLATLVDRRPGLGAAATTGLFLIAACGVLYIARSICIPLALASMLYFLLRPLVRLLGFAKIPKVLASTVVVAGLLAVIATAGVQVSEPAAIWVRRVPDALRTLEQRVRPLRQPVERVTKIAERVERATQVKAEKPGAQVAVQESGWFDEAVSGITEFAAEALVLLFALYFMLIYGDTLLERLLRFLPDLSERERTASVLNEVERRMSQYLRTITLINVALGVATTLTLMALRVPNPWLWGIVGALSNYVPYLGALATMCLLGIVSFVTYSDVWQAALPPLSYLLLTTIEGNFITPLILGRAFRVSPLVIFVWLVFWTWLWGVAGALV
ncbi:MAG TPA: AI-2E family transporter, partial [Polyangiaceae bacterium]|nr:AI-2E family transporter [Polyangiaceae bacterium]